ncbi:MAG: LysR family transcriptional regulator [Bacteroidetes bacterium]|nr:LysR family transcriptional regulator [Bacteroidota bacterium]
MAGTKGEKYYNVFLKYKIWLVSREEENILGDGKVNLLKEIDKQGSLQSAVNTIGISYRKAWGNLKKAEEILGFSLVEKHRGGQFGGTTTLTDEGRNLIEAYEELHKEIDETIKKTVKKFFNHINDFK